MMMAPHALFDLHDTSGYTPSQYNINGLVARTKIYSKSKACLGGTLTLSSEKIPSACVIGNPLTPRSQYFWRLSAEDVCEIEDSVEYFQRKTLSDWSNHRLLTNP